MSLLSGRFLIEDGDGKRSHDGFKWEFRFCPTWRTYNKEQEDALLHRTLVSRVLNRIV